MYRSSDYISYERTVDSREAQVEAAMQPSAGSGRSSKAAALELEQSMLDIMGDENTDMVKKQRIMRWDKSKKKYIATTLGDEASGLTHSKKVRLESGGKAGKKDMKLGKMYEKWQKKKGKSIGAESVFDEMDVDGEDGRAEKKDVNPRWQTKEKVRIFPFFPLRRCLSLESNTPPHSPRRSWPPRKPTRRPPRTSCEARPPSRSARRRRRRTGSRICRR